MYLFRAFLGKDHGHDSQPTGVKWVEALRASVRPVITYAFFILFATVKVAALFQLLDQGVAITDGLIAEWAVLCLINVPLTDGRFDVLVSFTHNLNRWP